MKPKKSLFHRLNTFQLIIIGFITIIFLGALLLTLPISSRAGVFSSFSDCIFTSVSATCVTGLVVQDTATYWSGFGQAVILILIQIGGMGVITVGMAIMKASGRKISLRQRSAMQESISAPQLGNIVSITGFIIKMSLIIEGIGAFLLAPVFIHDFGIGKGIWYSVWHSISAFCNAGFDLMGDREKFSSLCSYESNAYLNTVIMLLIILGGIGFLVWKDISIKKFHIKRYTLQTKIVLVTTIVLIILPAIYMFLFVYDGMDLGDRVTASFFQSVTTRTAGFNTTDLTQMNTSGTTIMIILMLIGGSPGSTAGGMKTVTFTVMLLSAFAVFRRHKDVKCFRRRIPEDAIRNAGAILVMYVFLFITSGMFITYIEDVPLLQSFFETGSAIGTVGLTLGLTTSLSLLSKIILMLLMFFGRVGGLTLIYAAVSASDNTHSRLPSENISVG